MTPVDLSLTFAALTVALLAMTATARILDQWHTDAATRRELRSVNQRLTAHVQSPHPTRPHPRYQPTQPHPYTITDTVRSPQ